MYLGSSVGASLLIDQIIVESVETIYFLRDQASIKSDLSFTDNPTLLTRPKRASASPTLSKTLFSSGLTSPAWSFRLVKVSELLVIAESSPRVSMKFDRYRSFFSAAASVGFEVLYTTSAIRTRMQ